MSRSTSRAGGSNQGYCTITSPGISSQPMQPSTSSTMANIGCATHLSPSLSPYGVYPSPSRGFPFPKMTSNSNICSLPMSRGASGNASHYEPIEGPFENLNIAHETTHFDMPLARGRYTRAQTPIAPPLLLSMSRHFPVLSDTSPLPSPLLEATSSVPMSVPPQRLRSILKNSSRGHPPTPVPGSASIPFECTPMLSAPSIPKRATFSNDTTEIEGASWLVSNDSGVAYRSCRGRPPTPLPEMAESEGEAGN
jgi:hypothetical protein